MSHGCFSELGGTIFWSVPCRILLTDFRADTRGGWGVGNTAMHQGKQLAFCRVNFHCRLELHGWIRSLEEAENDFLLWLSQIARLNKKRSLALSRAFLSVPLLFPCSLRIHSQKGAEVTLPSAQDPAGEFCITRCVNCQLLWKETLFSPAPVHEVSPGSSLMGEILRGEVWGKVSILLLRQKSQLDRGVGALGSHTKPFQSQDFKLQTLSKHRRCKGIQFILNRFCRLSFCCAAFLESKAEVSKLPDCWNPW